MTIDITIQQDEHINSMSHVSSLVMYIISISSTTESKLEEYYIQKMDNFTFIIKLMVPYNVHVQVNVSIVPALCGQSGRGVTFNTSFHYS